MFNWLTSPVLPDEIEAQAFRSISCGPILHINSINDRTNRMKLVPWEDILEVFPNAVYLRDANGIVMPARDHLQLRISPKSIKLQPDVVLEVVSSYDTPPTSTRPENILTTEDLPPQPTTTSTTSNSTPRSSMTRGSTEQTKHSSEPQASSETAQRQSQDTTPRQQTQEDDDWSPFQANSSSFSGPTLSTPGAPTITSTAGSMNAGQQGHQGGISNEVLRQEMIHRLELMSAEQEERLDIILKACRHRPTR